MKETFAGACAKALTGSAALTAAPNRLKLREVRLLKAREFDILVLLFVCSNALELRAYFVPAFLRSD